jgi:hypothetical protein
MSLVKNKKLNKKRKKNNLIKSYQVVILNKEIK